MTNPTKKFSEYVRQRQSVLELTNADIGRHIGTTGPNFHKWKNDNTFARECIPALTEKLEMDERTPEEVAARWVVKWRRTYRRDKTAADATALARAVTAMGRQLAPAFAAMQKVPLITSDVFRHMGKRDFWIATTVSVLPVIVRPPTTDDAKELFETRVGAILRDALFALFIPSSHCLQRLSAYRFAEMMTHDELTEGWADFHRRLLERLQREVGSDKEKLAKEIAHTRAQCFQCDELPLTALGWTVSLLGLQTSARQKDFRILVRGRFPDNDTFLMLPRAQHGIEQWMRQFVAATLEKAEGALAKKTDDESRWRLLFIRDLRDRLKP